MNKGSFWCDFVKGLALQILCLLFIVPEVEGNSYYFPKFGTPIVTQNHLIFSGPGWEPHRILCISRDKGKLLWQVQDTNSVLHPWFMWSNEVVITKGSNVFACELKQGHGRLLFKTSYADCGLTPRGLPYVLLSGERQNVDMLALIDIKGAKPLWEIPKVRSVIADGTNVMLCQQAERVVNADRSYTLKDQKITAFSTAKGNALWTMPMPQNCFSAEAVVISPYFALDLGGTIYCIEQATGKLMNKLQIQENPLVSVSLALRGQEVMVWTQEGRDVFSGHVVYALSVPELKKRQLAKTDWYSAVSHTYGDIAIGTTIGRNDAINLKTGQKVWQGGQWNWDGFYNGYIYYSTMEDNGTHTSINRIEVTTGKTVKLYEENLPAELQWKSKK